MKFITEQFKYLLKNLHWAILIAIIIIVLKAYNEAKEEIEAEEVAKFSYSEFSETIDGVDWYTYTNEYYGYQVSYPETVVFTKSSEMESLAETERKMGDAMFFITYDEKPVVHKIAGGSVENQLAHNAEELKTFFIEKISPNLIRGGDAESFVLDDFIIADTGNDENSAIEAVDSTGYRILKHNNQGLIYMLTAIDFDNSTTTPKDRLTKQIIDSFTLLD